MEQSTKKRPFRCINLDWLEVYCLEPSGDTPHDAEYFRNKGYLVAERAYGTRVYNQMFTVFDKEGVPLLEVRRAPCSDKAKDGGLFPSESCHIRLTNNYCYVSDPVGVLRSFLSEHSYTLVKIFRLDVCLDFETFDLGDIPAKFVARYMAGRYSKVYQSNISAHGTDRWEARVWQSISWGSPKSMIGTKMYCKSLELKQTHDKPYIRWCWYLCGLIDDPVTNVKIKPDGTKYTPDIWRVEFSIRSQTKRYYIIQDTDTRTNNSIYMPHTLDLYDSRDKLLSVFASLCHHYFHFKVFEEGVRKDRCEDKVLFDFTYMDEILHVDNTVSRSTKDDRVARLRSLLIGYRERQLNPIVRDAVDTIISNINEERLNSFVGPSWTAEQTFTLQRLLAERLGGYKRPDIVQQRKEIETLVGDLFATSWV